MSPKVFDACAGLIDADCVAADWMRTAGPHDVRSLGAWAVAQAAQFGSRPVVLAGHSTGGVIAMSAALAQPSRFAGIVLSGTGANTTGHGDVGRILSNVEHRWGDELVEAVVARSFDGPAPAELRDELRRYARQMSQRVVLDVLSSQAAVDLEPELVSLTVPALVVHGRFDAPRPMGHAQALARALRAELVLLDTGHTPMAEDPDGYAREVNRFLAAGLNLPRPS